jgi:protein SCO1/2
MTHVTSVIEKLGPLARYVFPLFVTFDPMRDTAEVVAEYFSHFDERILALTGTRSTIKAVQQRYGVLSIPGPKS